MKVFYCVRHYLYCFTIQGYHMGNCGENTAKNLGISREEQDAYGMESYRRSAEAYANNQIQPEIFEVSVPQKRGKAPPLIVKEDEEFKMAESLAESFNLSQASSSNDLNKREIEIALQRSL